MVEVAPSYDHGELEPHANGKDLTFYVSLKPKLPV